MSFIVVKENETESWSEPALLRYVVANSLGDQWLDYRHNFELVLKEVVERNDQELRSYILQVIDRFWSCLEGVIKVDDANIYWFFCEKYF